MIQDVIEIWNLSSRLKEYQYFESRYVVMALLFYYPSLDECFLGDKTSVSGVPTATACLQELDWRRKMPQAGRDLHHFGFFCPGINMSGCEENQVGVKE